MRKKILVSIIGWGLVIGSVVLAAPTSTIVQNLYITGIKPSAGTSTLSIDSTGLVSTTTIAGSGSATTTINNGSATATGPAFVFASGTTGNGFNISISGATVTFNCPNATGTVTGCLTSSDWTNFNSKISTSTGLTINNFASPNISQWTNNVPYLTSSTGVTSANGITGAVNWLASGPGLTVASSGQNITYTFASSSLNLGTLSVLNSPLPIVNGGTATTSIPTTNKLLYFDGTFITSTSTSFLTGNQTITFTASGDATGTATGATSINDSLTITGLQGKTLPALATGTLQYTGGAWALKTPSSTAYFIIENPTVSEDDAFYVFDVTSTITKVYAVNKSTGDTATFNLTHASSRNQSTSTANQVFTSYTAVTATTTPSCYAAVTTTLCATGTFGATASTTMNQGDVLRLTTTAASSSQFFVQVYFTPNQ